MRCARHYEERSDEAIQEFNDFDILGLLRFARNGGMRYTMGLNNETAPESKCRVSRNAGSTSLTNVVSCYIMITYEFFIIQTRT